MNDLPIHGTALTIGAIIGIPLGLLIAVVLFRSACDLCSVEPPGWLRSLAIVVVAGLVGSAVSFVVGLFAGAISRPAGMSDLARYIATSFVGLPLQGALAALLYKLLLHVGYLKALLIWAVQALLTILIAGGVVLLLIGGVTLVESILHVF